MNMKSIVHMDRKELAEECEDLRNDIERWEMLDTQGLASLQEECAIRHTAMMGLKAHINKLELWIANIAKTNYEKGFELAIAYLNAPMVDPGYESIQKPARAALNEWLEDNGYERVD